MVYGQENCDLEPGTGWGKHTLSTDGPPPPLHSREMMSGKYTISYAISYTMSYTMSYTIWYARLIDIIYDVVYDIVYDVILSYRT